MTTHTLPAGQSVSAYLTEVVESAFRARFPDASFEPGLLDVSRTIQKGFGDYQCNAAMKLAKVLKQAPRAIAEQVTEVLNDEASPVRVEVAGPGFLNLSIDNTWLASAAAELANDERLGVPNIGQGETVVMDYGSPNITKPLHIGHLRSHNIGSALDRMHRFAGFEVIADNHLGDWGTQFGITLCGWLEFGDEAALEADAMAELERVYVKSYERSREDEDWKTACRQKLVDLQSGEQNARELWQRFVDLSIRDLERVYARIGVRYDLVHGESYYHDMLPKTVADLEAKGLIRESEGALVAFLEDEGLAPCIVKKSDGGYNYATSDLATVESRVAEFNPSKIVYVTDDRQGLHFRQFFAITKKRGIETELVHVAFGLMRLPEKTFSTREGNVIPLEQLLDEAERRALAVVEETSPDIDAEQQREIARMVGVGAVKYADLSQNPASLVTFTWDKAMALNGNSAPYLQYAHARICSVLDKYADQYPDADLAAFPITVTEDVERVLILKLLDFPDTVARATLNYRPNALADYLFDLAGDYSSFYQNVPFLKAEEGVRESRLRLCLCVVSVLRKGLDLLGIEAPTRI